MLIGGHEIPASDVMDLEKTIAELSYNEKKVLLTLHKLHGPVTIKEITEKGDFSQDVEVANAASWLQSKKLVALTTSMTTVYSLGKDGRHFLDKGLPEKRALKYLADNGGSAPLSSLSKVLAGEEVPIAVGWLRTNGWATIKKDTDTILSITPAGSQAVTQITDVEKLLRELHEHPESPQEKTRVGPLLARKNVLKEKDLIKTTVSLTEEGEHVLQHGLDLTEEISQVTSGIIKSREWAHKTIRPYDIHAFAPAVHGGTPHPLIQLVGQIRQIFVEMGFQEIEGNYVESSFWNMDVLFIPQDHPAREMQDTLYCKTPKSLPITDLALFKKVAEVHENGNATGSTGWGYSFSKTEAERALLRTHTTVNTIRYLYFNPVPPAKVFSIGRVFRKESIDATHLPEFHQIEGIVHEEGATFRQLLGIIKEFYTRMGFEKIRFRPGYFPYTEPSMEVEVFWNGKWMELGGSGVFRPEVTIPVGVTSPVLAWGLGLERLAMLRFGLHDMRDLYVSDLDWIQSKPLL